MKFSYTHHMPYTYVDEAGQDWPIPNKQCVLTAEE